MLHLCPLYQKSSRGRIFLKHISTCRSIFTSSPVNIIRPSSLIKDENICSVELNESLPRRLKVSGETKRISSAELRMEFLDFFTRHEHTQVSPISVFPKRTEGSYFVNAGMNQFKNIMLGANTAESNAFRELTSATNSQSCIRLGGRSDDLNNVGFDGHHHTMFEMLGSWSFGKYDKKQACKYMWQFLVDTLRLPESALYVTYFGGDKEINLPADSETRDIWFELGVKDTKLLPFGREHNFWQADSLSGGGLCGPSTEIHVDLAALSSQTAACARCLVNTDNAQVLELWNTVFITHRRAADNQFVPLPGHFVDTGLGLERLAAILQGFSRTADSDAFAPLIENIHSHCPVGTPAYTGLFAERGQGDTTAEPSQLRDWHRDVAFRVVADHSRALAVAMHDGLLPGRQGLPLKLRQLVSRAVRASVFGLDADALRILKSSVALAFTQHVKNMQIWQHPGVVSGPNAATQSHLSSCDIDEILTHEVETVLPRVIKMETAFERCLSQVTTLDSQSADSLKRLMAGEFGVAVSPDMLSCQLKWYGLDPNLAHEVARSSAAADAENPEKSFNLGSLLNTDDSFKYHRVKLGTGKYSIPPLCTRVCGYFMDNEFVAPLEFANHALKPGDKISIVCERTNFYSPAGGQASDQGFVRQPGADGELLAEISEACKESPDREAERGRGVVLHQAVWQSEKVHHLPTEVELCVDPVRRTDLMVHHSAQHLFHASLKRVAGQASAQQQGGGQVHPDYCTIKVALPSVAQADLVEFVRNVEHECQRIVDAIVPICEAEAEWTSVAQDANVMRFPWESYPANIRVVWLEETDAKRVGELCAGTHVGNAAELQSVVVLGVQGRNARIKEFRVQAGERAQVTKRLGSTLITEYSAKMSHLPEESAELQKVAHAIHSELNRSDLSFLDRDRLRSMYAKLVERYKQQNSIDHSSLQPPTQRLVSLISEQLPKDRTHACSCMNISYNKVKDLHKALYQVEGISQPLLIYKSESPIMTLLLPDEEFDPLTSDAFDKLNISIAPSRILPAGSSVPYKLFTLALPECVEFDEALINNLKSSIDSLY